MKICMILGILISFLAIGGAADAGSTAGAGPLQGEEFQCNVINLGANVIQSLTIKILNSSNGDPLATETCVALEPNHECVANHHEFPNAVRAFCRVDSTAAASQIRGNFVVDGHVVDVR